MKNILRQMKLWQKFAALGVLGTAMCAVPLTMVLHDQAGQIQVARAESAGVAARVSKIAICRRRVFKLVLNKEETHAEKRKVSFG